jgi:hypothetical protein
VQPCHIHGSNAGIDILQPFEVNATALKNTKA